MLQVRSLGNGLHPVGPLTIANYALNPGMEVADSALIYNGRVNLCTNPSFEYGTTGWSAAGATPPVITQSLARSYVGSYSLQVAWQGAGSGFGTVNGPGFTTTIGQSYTVSVWIFTRTSSPLVTLTVNGATASSTLFNTWEKISVTFTAASTSATVAFTNVSGSSVGQFCWIDQVLYEQASTAKDYFDGGVDLPTSRTNLCTNPSFETNTTGWTPGGAVPTISISSSRALFGKKSALINWAASSADSWMQHSFTAVSGSSYTVSVYTYIPSGNPSAQISTVSGTSTTVTTNSSIVDDWQRLSITFTASSTTVVFKVQRATPVASGSCFLDAVLIEKGTLGNYFDGSLPTFNTLGIKQEWTGTAHASTSVQRIPAGTIAWNGTPGSSSSTRYDTGPKYWTATNASVVRVPVNRIQGIYSALFKPTSVSLMPRLEQTFSVIDLTNYSINFGAFLPATITGGGLTLEFSPLDGTNTLIQLDSTPLLLSGSPTLGYVRLATTYLPPAGTVTLKVGIRPTNQPSSLNDEIYIDNFMFEQADTPSETYVDGSFAGYCWAGVAHESTTLKTEFADALNFFGTYIWQQPHDSASAVPMRAHGTLHESPWSPVPLTD